MTVYSNGYDAAAEMLKVALSAMQKAGVPDSDVPPVLADFAMALALRLGDTAGGEALVERLTGTLERWREGVPPWS